MKKILLLIGLAFILNVNAQEKIYSTKSGKVKFKCESKAETIEATNSQATCKFSNSSGQITCLMLIKGFKFENSTMEEHFNENYMESTKFPKAEFKGNIENIKSVDFTKDGTYNITIKGSLTIHGTTKPITEKAVITVKAGKVSLDGKFKINIKDFGIKGEYIGSTIASDAQLTVSCKFD